jgi:hypothetical protein
MKPRRTHAQTHAPTYSQKSGTQKKNLKIKISYERRGNRENSLLFSLQTNNKHNNREIYQSINLSPSLSSSPVVVILGQVVYLCSFHGILQKQTRSENSENCSQASKKNKKKTGRKKENRTEQNRTEEDDAAAARERGEKRVSGCEGMEALETILGSLVQGKKTQRQDWKSSDRKERRKKTHTHKREQRTRRHSSNKRSWDRILSSA